MIEWPWAAAVLSTLFLNFAFWMMAGDLVMFVPFPLYVGVAAGVALMMTVLFFLGPALAGLRAGLSLMGMVEASLGKIPAFLVRGCCVVFLLLWIVKTISLPIWWLSQFIWRDPSPIVPGLISASLLIFLFVTGVKGVQMSAKLAGFTIRLGIAVLIAALLRVHAGWPAILKGPFWSGRSIPLDLIHGVSSLSAYLAPLMFLAGDFGHLLRGRRSAVMTALMGLTLPLFGTVLAVGLIGVATLASPFYQPSLQPNVGMAL